MARMRGPWPLWVCGLFVGLCVCTAPAAAHTFAFTEVQVSLGATEFGVEVTCDLDALALGVDPSADSAALAAEIANLPVPARDELAAKLTEFMTRRLRLRFDGTPAPFTVSFPGRGKPGAPGTAPSYFGLVAHLDGPVPKGAKEATFFASRAFPLVRLVWRSAGGRPVEEVLVPGAESHPYALAGSSPALATGEIAGRFLALGFTHILPKGLDHVLFVVGLALLVARPRPAPGPGHRLHPRPHLDPGPLHLRGRAACLRGWSSR